VSDRDFVLTTGIAMVRVDCQCGGVYALTEPHYRTCREQGKGWTCPYCRTGWGFSGKGENQQLKAQLEKANTEIKRQAELKDAARKERDHHWTERKKLQTRHSHLRERVKNGVCPCCRRNFENLQRHMKTQHPGYKPAESGVAS
jgi:hypothetical protein